MSNKKNTAMGDSLILTNFRALVDAASTGQKVNGYNPWDYVRTGDDWRFDGSWQDLSQDEIAYLADDAFYLDIYDGYSVLDPDNAVLS